MWRSQSAGLKVNIELINPAILFINCWAGAEGRIMGA